MLKNSTPRAFYHGSDVPDIVRFRSDSERFSLLGEGIYFYQKSQSAKQYGKYLYRVKLPSGIKIAPQNSEFGAHEIDFFLGVFGVNETFDPSRHPAGVLKPLWWATDGFDYFGLSRKAIVETIARYMQKKGYDGILADYPRGGLALCLWRKYDKLQPFLVKGKMAGIKRTAIEWSVPPTDAHFTLLKLLRNFWDFSGVSSFADFYKHVDVRFEQDGIKLHLYTEKRRYAITATLERDYLGCVMNNRAANPSEDWNHGSDLAYGDFCIHTWQKIVSDMLSCELLDIAKDVMGNPKWQEQNSS